MADRLKTLEDTDVVKVIHNLSDAQGEIDSDIIITMEDE